MTLSTTRSSTRIETIDILRGFTLFGIIIIHMVEQYYAGRMPDGVGQSSISDNIVEGIVAFLIMGKFFMIFSFLFGLSFFLQFSKTDSNFLGRFAWRLLLLGIIGLIHHLHYRGDILTIYAMLGFFLLIFNRLSDKALLITGILLTINVPSILLRVWAVLVDYDLNSLFSADQTVLKEYFETVKHGSYVAILKANFLDFGSKMIFQVWSGRLFITLGLFLLGVYVGRKKFFENIDMHYLMVKKGLKYALFLMLGCILGAVIFFVGAAALKIPLSGGMNLLIGVTLFDFFNTALAFVYVGGTILLMRKVKWQKILHHLYPVGRMGLTTYLMQSLYGTLIYFSYGFGQLGELGAGVRVLIALGLFLLQIVFAKAWFSYFQYGPVEWLWRSLTFFKVQPMVKQVPTMA